jgi:hypothetical protein
MYDAVQRVAERNLDAADDLLGTSPLIRPDPCHPFGDCGGNYRLDRGIGREL